MTHCRQALVVLAASLFIAPLVSTSPAGAASHPAHHGVVIDSTPYQSVQQLLGNTQIMVVARVESETRDRSAFQPASLVTVHVHHVLRGSVGKHLVVVQPRASKPHAGKATQVALQSGRTYLLLLDRSPGESTFFLVGGTAGEFLYDGTTKRFTRQDTAASWENSDFPLSLAEAGASAMPQTTQPSWLAPGGSAGPQAVSWSAMANDLGISPTDVACPSENLCLFAGDVAPTSAGMLIPAVAVSTGPFRPHANIVGTTTSFLPTSDYSQSSVACAGAGLCVFSSSDGVYVSTDPATGHWTLDVAPSPAYNFGQVSCPTASFCAVASGEGVLVSGSPSAGPTAWAYIHIGPLGRAISCPSPQLCVAGGYGNETVGGWIATSTSPLAAVSWHGGPTPHPAFAQHSGQYGVTGISCPTTAFCIAAIEAGDPLVSTNPAGGVRTWTEAAHTNVRLDTPGFAHCTPAGQCDVSGVGSFTARGGAPGPGITGYPLPGVSCVSSSFCVTVADQQLAVTAGAV